MPGKLYQRIYLSPHLDDAVLSCGGRIYQERQAGLLVLVLTIMAGDPPPGALDSPYVTELHTRWELHTHPNPVAARRAEDVEALSVLDVCGLYWEWPDCIYRRHTQTGDFLYHSEATLLGPVHPDEERLIEELARRLGDLPLTVDGKVCVPLAVGGHVDHRLVRQATEACISLKDRLIFYEDYPYAERAEALRSVLGEGDGWRAETILMDEQDMAVKTKALTCYRSQLSTFFAGHEEMASRLRAYATVVGGGKGWAERYWHRIA